MRSVVFALIAASFIAASPALAQTQRGGGQAPAAAPPTAQTQRTAPRLRVDDLRPGLVTVRQPRFSVHAWRIIANNETGWDSAGSDEIYAVYRDLSGSGLIVFTAKFGDVDTGEIKNFGSANKCITPIVDTAYGPNGYPISWRCDNAGAPGPVRFRVTLYESDGWSPMACAAPPNAPPTPQNCDDDNLGSFTHTYTQAQLVNRLPRVGDTFTTEARVNGYTFAYIVERLADHVTQRPAISGAVQR
jgi:hypothetical protein